MNGKIKRRPGSVFVDVAPPVEATYQVRASDYFSEWTRAAQSIVADASPPAPEETAEVEVKEPCRAKICLNRSWIFTADSKHCQKRAGCILRKDKWDAKDREWLRCVGDAVCVVAGVVLSWGVLVLF